MNLIGIAATSAVIFLALMVQSWIVKRSIKTIGVLHIVKQDGMTNYAFGVDPSVKIPESGYVKFKVIRGNNISFNEMNIRKED